MTQKFAEYQYEDAFEALNNVIYTLEDKIASEMLYVTNLDEILKQLNSSEKYIGQMLEAEYPESKLIEKYGFAQNRHHVQIYQIDSLLDANEVKFRDLKEGQKPDPGIYMKVFGGYIPENNLEDIYLRFNTISHPDYIGHSLSISDIVVVNDEAHIYKRYGFEKVDFDTTQVPDLKRTVKNLYITRNRNTNDVLYASFNKHNAIKKMNELWEQVPNFKKQFNSLETSAFEVYSHSLETPKMILKRLEEENTNYTDLCEPIAECAAEHSEAFKMLVIPPNQHPYEAYIYDSLDAWQVMVDGDIECTYPFNDGTFLVGNGNARINGLEGNRTINGNIYAGTILLAADNGESGVKNLSEAQVLKHKQKLWEPENISPESVKNYSMKFYSFPDSPNQNQFFEITM